MQREVDRWRMRTLPAILEAAGGSSAPSRRKISRILDAVYPMVYPSHFGPGEYNLPDPNADPGRTVAYALADFRKALAGHRAKLIPWLQDFSLGRTYTLDDVEAQINSAREAHARGFLLWNAAGLYTHDALAAR